MATIDFNSLVKLTASAEETFDQLKSKVTDAKFVKGSDEPLFGKSDLYWKPSANKTNTTEASFRIMPQSNVDIEILQDENNKDMDLGKNPNMYAGHNLCRMSYYNIWPKKGQINPFTGKKRSFGGKFVYLSPDNWIDDNSDTPKMIDDGFMKWLINDIYMAKYGHFTKGSPERTEGYKKFVAPFKPLDVMLANVLVLKDTTKPENEGKVWLYDIKQKTLQKKFFGDLETNDQTGSFLSTKDRHNRDKVAADIKDYGPEGCAVDLSLIYEIKTFGKWTGPVMDIKESEIEQHTNQTILEDINEFIFAGKGKDEEVMSFMNERMTESQSLLKYYDKAKYFVDSEQMIDEFCKMMEIDRKGNPLSEATSAEQSGITSTQAPAPDITSVIDDMNNNSEVTQSSESMEETLAKMMKGLD